MKKNWIYIVLAVLVIAAGIGIYFYFKKDKEEEKPDSDKKEPSPNTAPAGNAGPATNTFANSKTGNRDRVKEVQRFINSLGYTPKLDEDGVWGPKTSAAVQSVFKTTEVSEAQWASKASIAQNWAKPNLGLSIVQGNTDIWYNPNQGPIKPNVQY